MLSSLPVNMLIGACCPTQARPTHTSGVQAIGFSVGRSSFGWSQGLPSRTLLTDPKVVGKLRFIFEDALLPGKIVRARPAPSPDLFLLRPTLHSNLPHLQALENRWLA